MKKKMKEKKTEITMWTGAESKFAQEKAKRANLNPSGINLQRKWQKAKLTKIQKEFIQLTFRTDGILSGRLLERFYFIVDVNFIISLWFNDRV